MLAHRTPGALRITIAICTRNRAASLARTLTSLTELEDPKCSYEVLVVDNGSTDATQAKLAAFAEALPLTWTSEPEPGLSHARNRAVRAARGDYIVWTDDDVTVDKAWLAAYASAFAREPQATVFGGAVVPQLEPPVPAWVGRSRGALRYLLAEREPTAQSPRFDHRSETLPFGANFAVRRAEQAQELYDVALGASPLFNRLGEEEDVIRRILAKGGYGAWVADAKVLHHIPAQRLTIGYVAKYSRAGGETWAYQQARDHASRRFPVWAVKSVLKHYPLYRLHRWRNAPEQWVPHLCHWAYGAGALEFAAKSLGRAKAA